MGDKLESKRTAIEAGVNTIPGYDGVLKVYYSGCISVISLLVHESVSVHVQSLTPTNWAALVAQLVERLPRQQSVVGSNPTYMG